MRRIKIDKINEIPAESTDVKRKRINTTMSDTTRTRHKNQGRGHRKKSKKLWRGKTVRTECDSKNLESYF